MVEKGFLVPSIKWILRHVSCASLYVQIWRRNWSHEELIPFWYAEVYTLLGLTCFAFAFVFVPVRSVLWHICWIAAVYRLLELGYGLSSIIILHRERRRDDQGYYVLARNALRWVLLTLINLAELIIYFSFFYLTWNTHFEPEIATRMAAIYQSVTTLVAVGGTIPTSDLGRGIVISQLCYFVFFLVLVAPVVLSLIRAKERTTEELGKGADSDRLL